MPLIESISYGGNGAPQGTVGQSISDDRETSTLVFDSFVASSGPGVPITESRKSAQFNYNLSSPHSRALFTETFRGYVQLPAGVKATIKVTVPHGEGGKTKTSAITIAGPVAKDYTFFDTAHLLRKLATESVTVSIQLTGPNSTQAQVTVDSLDGTITAPGQGDGGDGDDDGGDDDGD